MTENTPATVPRLLLVDGSSYLYRAFHAMPDLRADPTDPHSAPTGAIRGMINMLGALKKDYPDAQYAACVFDASGPTFRDSIYPEYKANRSEMPDDLRSQLPVIRRLFEAFGVPALESDNFEADDVIATVARRGVEAGFDVTILTSDKDARQLLGPHVRIINLRDNKVIDEAALKADWGIAPNQVVDYLSLTGDTVDNVPGVPGIGPKGAGELLQKFGDLETILARVGEVSGAKRQQNLRESAEIARRARHLVTLREDVPLGLDWEALHYKGYDPKALKALCMECGFHRFLDEIADDSKPTEASWDLTRYVLVNTPELFTSFLQELAKQKKVSFDTETTGLDASRADLVGCSFSWREGDAYYVPVRGPMWCKSLDPTETLNALRPFLTDPTVEKVGQNLKFDMLVLRKVGITIEGPITDTMVLSYLLESGERNHSLDELARRLLNHTMVPISDLIGKGKNEITMDQVDVARVAEYAGEDADAAWRLEAILTPKVKSEGLWDLYADLERPLIGVLAGMEAAGIKLDVARLQQLSREFGKEISGLETQVYHLAGRTFNIASGPQLRVVLFDDLKLPVLQKTPKGEPSTAAEVLEELALKHELPRLLIRHRQLSKLKSTYLDALGPLTDTEGRVHTSFNQVVAATGRLSSSDPNLQNIPTRTEDGRQIRQAFVAGWPGWSLLTADYSQIELRVLAHFCGDPALVKAFNENRDIHTVVASKVFGVPEAEVDSAQRRMAKTVNFGVIYGQSAFGLAARLGIPQKEAEAFINAYFQEYAGVDAFITKVLEEARDQGRVTTILGRRRAISGIKATTGRVRNLPERTAINTVIQGSAADLIKKAMLDVDRRLNEEKLKARMLLQIHDELVFEAPDEELPRLAALVREAMTTALPLNVPLDVDIAAGRNWLDVGPIASG